MFTLHEGWDSQVNLIEIRNQIAYFHNWFINLSFVNLMACGKVIKYKKKIISQRHESFSNQLQLSFSKNFLLYTFLLERSRMQTRALTVANWRIQSERHWTFVNYPVIRAFLSRNRGELLKFFLGICALFDFKNMYTFNAINEAFTLFDYYLNFISAVVFPNIDKKLMGTISHQSILIKWK